jgi:hypothetical protein
VAGVGVVGTTSVAGIPVSVSNRIALNIVPSDDVLNPLTPNGQASVLGTILCAPILLLLEGEGSSGGGRKKYQVSSTKSKSKGLVLTLTRSNWFAPLLAGTVAAFLVTTCYAIFLRGCGLSKFSFLFGAGDLTKRQDDVLSHVHGSASKITGIRALDDVATLAKMSVVHTRTMVASVKLDDSGIWTARNVWGPLMHILGLVSVLPSLQYLVRHSCFGAAHSARKVLFVLPLNVLAMTLGRGIPSLIALAAISCVGGMIQYHSVVEKGGRVGWKPVATVA